MPDEANTQGPYRITRDGLWYGDAVMVIKTSDESDPRPALPKLCEWLNAAYRRGYEAAEAITRAYGTSRPV